MGCGVSSAQILPHDPQMKLQGMNSVGSPPEITSNALQQFLEIENAIADCEKKFMADNFHVKAEQLEHLELMTRQLSETRDETAADAKELSARVGLSDLKTTKDMLLRKRFDGVPATDQEEKLLDLLNRKEITERELAVLEKQKNSIQEDMELMGRRGERLNELHVKRDAILDAIFMGQYGSDTEQQLEKEADWLLEQKHHVEQANFRWSESLRLTQEAVEEIAKAVNKWCQLPSIPDSNMEKRYYAAADTRNHLVSANQNIFAALRYLPNIEVPYCNTGEMEVLDKAISFIFFDMQSPERHDHALRCYNTTHKRVAALRQWLTQVINTTIARDLIEVQDNCKAKAAELRNERLRLIKGRLKELTGRDSRAIDFHETPVELRDSGFDSELEESVGTDELRRLFSDTRSSTPNPTPRTLIMPTPVPSADLAPMPSTDEIFGKIDFLQKRHKQDVQEFTRHQRLAQARMSQGLKEKLNERRSRRSRLEMHSRQMEALRET